MTVDPTAPLDPTAGAHPAGIPGPTPVLRLTSPSAVAAAVPGLLGFHPQDSLVVIALATRRVRLTLRVDLPEPVPDRSWSAQVVDKVRQGAPDADEVLLVVFPPGRVVSRGDLPHVALLDRLTTALEGRDLRVRDALCVADGRWFSYRCDDDLCCPATGSPLDDDEAVLTRAGLDLAGVAPLPSRSDLCAELTPTADGIPDLVGDLLCELDAQLIARLTGTPAHRDDEPLLTEIDRDELESWRTEQIEEIGDVLRRGRVDLRDTSGLALGLNDIRVRDTVLWDLMAEDREGAWRAAALALACAVRCLPSDSCAPAATVLAICRWQLGDGARARVAIERALQAESGYSLALLVHAALDHGLPPPAWREAMSAVSREECRTGRAAGVAPTTGRRPGQAAARAGRRSRGREDDRARRGA